MMGKKTILATCYAINPYKGSEDGTGWNFVLQIAKHQNVIAITRENNQKDIERFQAENPNELYANIQFLYFDLPYWLRFWKKGSRGAMLYFIMWQKGIVRFIQRQHLHFDIVHNVNFHSDWTPSYLWKLEKPFVWGPIGHHSFIPKQFLKPYSKKYAIKDTLTWSVKKYFWKFSKSLRKTVSKANHILCINSSVEKVLFLNKNKHSILPAVATEDFNSNISIAKKDFIVMSVGRFAPLKGFDLTILSFIEFLKNICETEKQHCKLKLFGTGPEKTFYQKLISDNHANENIEIIEWLDRKDLMKEYENASVFLFPSHEGAGMVVAEALSFSLPVICLKNDGPGELINEDCGITIPIQNYENTIADLSKAILSLYENPELLKYKSFNARQHYLQNFTWNSRAEILKNVYQNI